MLLVNPVKPHSEGEIVLSSADPLEPPEIRMNYFSDPHDMKVMIAVIRRALDVVANWPSGRRIGPLRVPTALAAQHGHVAGEDPSDELIEDMALHDSLTVYHLTSTCRIGSVVDPQLRVLGVDGLRVADARRDAGCRQRQHQCGVHHDRREGGGDHRPRARRLAGRVRRRGRSTARSANQFPPLGWTGQWYP